MTDDGRFREQLKRLLANREISCSELARRTGVPKQTISDWLGGTRPRNMEYVRRVAEQLDVTIMELFFGEDSKSPIDQGGDGKFFGFSEVRYDLGPNEISEYLEDEGVRKNCDFLFDNVIGLFQIRTFPDGRALFLSPSWETGLGWSREELKGKHWMYWIHPADRQQTIQVIERQISSKRSQTKIHHRFIHKNGRYFNYETILRIDREFKLLMSISFRIGRDGKFR